MTRAEIVSRMKQWERGSCGCGRPAVLAAAIAELESLDLTPEQRAEKRLREACPWVTEVRIAKDPVPMLPRDWRVTAYGPEPDDFRAHAYGATPNEAVDRLLARVK